MKLGIPKVTKRTVTRNGYHEILFLGGIELTNIPEEEVTNIYTNAGGWKSPQIDAGSTFILSTAETGGTKRVPVKYTAIVDTTEFPMDSNDWEEETTNEYKFLDDVPTTKTLVNGNFECIVDTKDCNYIIGNFIEGASHVKLYEVDYSKAEIELGLYRYGNGATVSNVPNGNLVADIEMIDVVDFECFECCNPAPEEKRSFGIDLKDIGDCLPEGKRYFKLVIETEGTLRIGQVAVLRAYDFGCVSEGTTLKIDKNVDFKQTKIMKNIEVLRWGATINVSGSCYMPTKYRQRNLYVTTRNNGLSFLIIDDLDSIDNPFVDIISGEWSDNGFPYTNREFITVKFEMKGVLA